VLAVADVRATGERVWLDERSWVDVFRGWLPDADDVHAAVLDRASWFQGRVVRYERYVDEPRLSASSKPGLAELHPGLIEAHRRIRREYGVEFAPPALALYRDGRESVAFHCDRELRWLEDTVIGVLSLGATRPWLLRPRRARYDHEAPNGGATHDLQPASGDLLVMGGRCQADWHHAVPKVAAAVGPRISLQWRWTSKRGRPETGPNYRAPRTYSR
jgi:alkylated DNA repair dioxygenase AlkB